MSSGPQHLSRHAPEIGREPLPQGWHGPLAPWRFTLSVAAVALSSGTAIADAAATGVGLDMALGRAIAVALIMWLALGTIDRTLARADYSRALDELEATRLEAEAEAEARAAEVAEAAEAAAAHDAAFGETPHRAT